MAHGTDLRSERIVITFIMAFAVAGIVIAILIVFFRAGGGNFVTEQAASVAGHMRGAAASDADFPLAAFNTRYEVARERNIPEEEVHIVSVEEWEWPDACVGRPKPSEFCAQELTPGYLIVFEIEGEAVTYRTERYGAIVRRDS